MTVGVDGRGYGGRVGAFYRSVIVSCIASLVLVVV